MAKKTSKHLKRRLYLLGPASIVIFGITLYTIFSSLYTINKLTEQKELLETNLVTLEDSAVVMEEEIEKLKDPEYIAKYARENYYYTKDGEYVLKFEKIKEDKEVAAKFNVEAYYKLGFLFIGLLIIFIFIVKRIQKHK